MALLSTVKTALRIRHSELDADIEANIAAAQEEMVRNSILVSKATDEFDPLVVRAIKTYCQAMYTDNTSDMEKYLASWQYQLDCLRKTASYNEVTGDV